MNKTDAIATVIRETTDEPVIFTTGYSCRIARSIADRANHFYMTGSMGLAANIGIGVALASRRPVVVVDGDGSLTMNPSCLFTAGALPDLRLVHLVLDDRSYESTGGQAVPSERIRFGALALAAGYRDASQTGDVGGLSELLRAGLRCAGPTFVHCTIDSIQGMTPPPRIEPDLRWLAMRFTEYVKPAACSDNP
ncbi:thiamine pyrophosphate-dependent enzyme [Solwaraspora sp. WMMB335]|uniref:thiamine pyrophosphate-dependent enzyme n=1 Tax=Solwaraspora sp. WMMB335 TaxID=3404118 RepID=UPI003B9527EC